MTSSSSALNCSRLNSLYHSDNIKFFYPASFSLLSHHVCVRVFLLILIIIIPRTKELRKCEMLSVCTPPEIFFLPMQRELNGVERGKKYMMFKLLTLCLCRLLDFTLPHFCTDIFANTRPTYFGEWGKQIPRHIHQSSL